MVVETSASDVAPAVPPSNAMCDMPVSPASVASSGHFPFTASEISGMGIDTSVLDSSFPSDVPDNGVGISRDVLRSLDQIPWDFNLSDLTADLSNLGGNLPHT